jgi:hypothetical protein
MHSFYMHSFRIVGLRGSMLHAGATSGVLTCMIANVMHACLPRLQTRCAAC